MNLPEFDPLRCDTAGVVGATVQTIDNSTTLLTEVFTSAPSTLLSTHASDTLERRLIY